MATNFNSVNKLKLRIYSSNNDLALHILIISFNVRENSLRFGSSLIGLCISHLFSFFVANVLATKR